MKMNRKNLFLLAGFSFLAMTQLLANSNDKGIEYYRAELYGAAKIFFLEQKNQPPAEQAENYYYLGQTYFQLNQVDSASYYFQKASEVFPDYPFGYIGMGKMELKKGNAKAADDLFKKANSLAKKDPSVQTTIAEAYIDVNDTTNAAVALDRARKVDSKFSGIYIAEGDMLMKQGKVGEACTRYDNAILFNNKDKAAYLKSAQVYKDINPAEALKYLDKLIALDPNYIPAYAVLGDIYREKGQYQKALDAYEKFIAIAGVPLLQHERYAQTLFFSKQYEKALDHIKYVIENDPDNLVMKRLEAYNSFRLENYSDGLKQMRKFLKEMPKERHIYQDYMTLGQLALKEKQPQEALEAFQKAIQMDSTKTEIFKVAATAASNAGLYSAAVTYYEKYLALDPEAETLDFYYYGDACYAAASFYVDPQNQASATTPDAIAAFEAAFKNFVQKGDAAYTEVIKRKPDLQYGYMGRAKINSLLDKYEGDKTGKNTGWFAKPFFEQAIPVIQKLNTDGSKNGDLITAYRYLISYYYSNNDLPNVIGYCKKILEADPNDDKSKEILTSLKVKY
jgi:tetratricopeptide (TPR) repeat protein